MVLMESSFDAYSYHGLTMTYQLHVKFLEGSSDSSKNLTLYYDGAEAVAYLVNKYGRVVRVLPFGYIAEIPPNAALAIKYLAKTSIAPSNEELDDIVRTGETDIHRFVKRLGFNPEGLSLKELFDTLQVNRMSPSLSLKEFPVLTLHIDGEILPLRFRAEDIEPEFLGRVLRNNISKDEYEMLRGIALLGERTQRKYICLLSRAQLTLVKLAKTLYRATVSSRDDDCWKKIIEWFKRNGFQHYASEIVVKKTLL